MWNRKLKRILLAIISIYILYWLVNLWIRENGELLNWLVFSDRGYLKHIEQEAFVMTKQGLADFISKPDNQPIQETKEELKHEIKNGEDLYILLRVQNLSDGGPGAWGNIVVTVNGKEQSPINIGLFLSREKFIPMYIIPLDPKIVFSKKSPEVPKIEIYWLNIYHK